MIKNIVKILYCYGIIHIILYHVSFHVVNIVKISYCYRNINIVPYRGISKGANH